MTDQLTEAEELCRKILDVLQTPNSLPAKKNMEIGNKVRDLLARIIASRKKIMVRSPEGRVLSVEVLNNASKTFEVVSAFSKHGNDVEAAKEVTGQLSHLEDSIEKLEIYWKSFEYVTT